MKRSPSSILVILLAVTGAAAAGAWWWQNHGGAAWMASLSGPVTAVGAGDPLPPQSSARIELVEEPTPMPAGLGGGEVRIGEPLPVAAMPAAPAAQLDDLAGLKLGTSLALLTQAYANGGPLARSMANVVQELAREAGQADLARVADTLRNATPMVGPMTIAALTNEAQRMLTAGAPADLPVSATVPAASDSWWTRQLEKFVTIKRGGEASADAWTRQLRLAQAQLARASAADAKLTLQAVPLAGDARLDLLRRMTEEYLDQQGKLTNLLNTYVRVYLNRALTEEGR